MEWLNYHHLLYFWLVAREESLARASQKLRLAQSTVSGQVRTLEESLGQKLFVRSGRRLQLTDTGRLVFRYADEIFTVGRELQDTLKGRPVGRPLSLVVGIADVVPKLVARRLIEPALQLDEPVRLVCREGRPERILAALATHEIDVVISDSPVPPSIRVQAFNHLLGECDVTFLATKALAEAHRRKFPASLDGAPMLLPAERTTLRRALDQWFNTMGIQPQVVGEFEDSALLKVFGQTGLGIFAAPSVIAHNVRRQYQVRSVGRTGDVTEKFYAISVERRIQHPAVVAIQEAARTKLFG